MCGQVADAKLLPDEFGLVNKHAILQLRCSGVIKTYVLPPT